MTDDLFPEGEAIAPALDSSDPMPDLPAPAEQPTVPAFFGVGGRGAPIRGMEMFSPEQLGLRPPRLQLIQRLDRRDDVGRPGEWRLNKEVLPEPEIVILKGHPGRQFMEGEGRDTRIICASSDGVEPHSSILHPKCEKCGECPYSQWRGAPGGSRVPPPCSETFSFLVVIPELQNKPAWLVCAKTAMISARTFVQAFQQMGEEGFVKQLCDMTIRLTSESKQRGGAGSVTYYLPIFTILPKKPEPHKLYTAMTDQVLQAELEYLPRVMSSMDAEDLPPASAAREVMDASSDGGGVPF